MCNTSTDPFLVLAEMEEESNVKEVERIDAPPDPPIPAEPIDTSLYTGKSDIVTSDYIDSAVITTPLPDRAIAPEEFDTDDDLVNEVVSGHKELLSDGLLITEEVALDTIKRYLDEPNSEEEKEALLDEIREFALPPEPIDDVPCLYAFETEEELLTYMSESRGWGPKEEPKPTMSKDDVISYLKETSPELFEPRVVMASADVPEVSDTMLWEDIEGWLLGLFGILPKFDPISKVITVDTSRIDVLLEEVKKVVDILPDIEYINSDAVNRVMGKLKREKTLSKINKHKERGTND